VPLPKTPKVTWGTSFANTWTFPGPIDNPIPTSNVVGAVAESDSGLRDLWETRTDDDLSLVVRFIPRVLANGVTGYSDATTGVYEALEWLYKQNIGRYFPDKDTGSFHSFYLLEYNVDREKGGTHYRVEMKIRDSAGTAFTDAY
jgi:hypothetical protein